MKDFKTLTEMELLSYACKGLLIRIEEYERIIQNSKQITGYTDKHYERLLNLLKEQYSEISNRIFEVE